MSEHTACVIVPEAEYTAQVQVALRERYLEIIFIELGFDLPQVGCRHGARPLDGLRRQPYHQLEIEAAVAEFDEPDLWLPGLAFC